DAVRGGREERHRSPEGFERDVAELVRHALDTGRRRDGRPYHQRGEEHASGFRLGRLLTNVRAICVDACAHAGSPRENQLRLDSIRRSKAMRARRVATSGPCTSSLRKNASTIERNSKATCD